MTKSPEKALKPCEIDRESYAHIGRMIRAFAEIEDIVTLYICKLAGISESTGQVLLGRMPLSARIAAARYLAKTKNPKIVALHDQIFDARFSESNRLRNAFAHGVLLGVSDDGYYAFRTTDTVEPDSETAKLTVIRAHPKTIKGYADDAVNTVPKIAKALQLDAFRQTRHERPLADHPKRRPQPTKKAKRQRPPRS